MISIEKMIEYNLNPNKPEDWIIGNARFREEEAIKKLEEDKKRRSYRSVPQDISYSELLDLITIDRIRDEMNSKDSGSFERMLERLKIIF